MVCSVSALSLINLNLTDKSGAKLMPSSHVALIVSNHGLIPKIHNVEMANFLVQQSSNLSPKTSEELVHAYWIKTQAQIALDSQNVFLCISSPFSWHTISLAEAGGSPMSLRMMAALELHNVYSY